MSEANTNRNRRDFLKTTSTLGVAATIAAASQSRVHGAQDDDSIQVCLIGCGGRGTGAASNAMSVNNGNVKLVGMADVMPHKLSISYRNLEQKHADKMDVPEERRWVGFDAYKQAMDYLRPGDIVILTTPVAFRWLMFGYAIDKGLNVFMEKPIATDGDACRRMFALGKKADEKNLKVGVGLMCRHCEARGELFERIQEGQIGDLTMLRAYRQAGITASAHSEKKPEGKSELMYQIDRFHSFLWLSGGAFSDFLIHNIDEACWMKDDWPISAQGSGGRHYRQNYVDQNFDTYSVEYTFKDGTKFFMEGRTIPGAHSEFATYAHGTRGSAIVSTSGHAPAKPRLYSGHLMKKKFETWAYPQPEKNPYQLEWDHLIDSIKNDKPHNEVERGTKASLVTSMGRMASHTGQIITYDDMLESDHVFAPGLESLTLDGPSPLQADENGLYPIPMPGLKSREY